MKLSKNLMKNKKLAFGLISKRGYAEAHPEVKNEIYISDSYTKKWGFLTPQQYDEWEESIDRDLKEIHERHQKIREEKMSSWTPAQKYPWYTPEQLQQRERNIELNRRHQEREERIRQEEAEREQSRGPIDLDKTFGTKSREILWRRYFQQNGNNAPPEPRSTIRITCEEPFGKKKHIYKYHLVINTS